MPRLLYTALLYLLLPFIPLRLWYRSLRAPDYRRRIGERFGFFPAPIAQGGVWVHAVSVGEVLAAAPLIRHFLDRYPGQSVTVTTMTPTGSERVRALFGQRVLHVYVPYDMPDAVARFLRRVRPRLLVIMETEIWPNIVHACRRRDIPVVLANARLSERSARGYARLGKLARQTFSKIDRVVAQSAADGRRFTDLGLPAERLRVSGSIKFDISIGADIRATARRLKTSWSESGKRPVWIAASTHDGEDELVLDACRRLRTSHPSALLILVPRHPERFGKVESLVKAGGLSCYRRSQGEILPSGVEVLLGDTMGELLTLFGCADIAFVGGSLVATGGHNSLEPAAWGLPIVTGPSDFNFAEISRLLREAGALKVIDDSAELAAEVAGLLDNPAAARRAGDAAMTVVAANKGALARLLGEVDGVLRETREPGRSRAL